MPDEERIIARIMNGSSSEIRIRETSYKGVDYIDVRKFYFDPPDESHPAEDAKKPAEFFKPTKKGISLRPEQWSEVMEKVQEAIEAKAENDG